MASSGPPKCETDQISDLAEQPVEQNTEEPCKVNSPQQSRPPQPEVHALDGVHLIRSCSAEQVQSPPYVQHRRHASEGHMVHSGGGAEQPADRVQEGAVVTSLSRVGPLVPPCMGEASAFKTALEVQGKSIPDAIQLGEPEPTSAVQEKAEATRVADAAEEIPSVATSVSRADGLSSDPVAAGMSISPETLPTLEADPPKSTLVEASSFDPAPTTGRPTQHLDSTVAQQTTQKMDYPFVPLNHHSKSCEQPQGGALFHGAGQNRSSVVAMRNANIHPPAFDYPKPSPMERALAARVRDEDGVIDLKFAKEVQRRAWMCVACWERRKNVTMKPCDHECLCWECFKEPIFSLQDPLRCPVCQQDCKGVKFSPALQQAILQNSQKK
ncbi:hypothetical protein BaRGS_00017452 [Batillaria attramentaria]|uniref:RING-type domain-containing protein n=1 Tax=Batillaria attramentaria TaxID=370345 RepID=A0ABD0KVM6_9CAEN